VAVAAPSAQAQSTSPATWCPAGATWVYGYGLFNESGTLTVRYVRDTVVAGQPAQLLTRRINSSFYVGPNASVPGVPYNLTSVVTRVAGDRVEVQANGQFYTLYDFAAQPGASWLTAPVTPQGPCPQGLVQVTVDSVGRQQVGGRSLRWLRVHLTAAAGTTIAGGWSGRIYEQLGNVSYMQPQSPICRGTDPGFMGGLRSFQASGLPSLGVDAGTGTLLASAEARSAAAGFSAFPNPSAGLLTLQLPTGLSGNARLQLLDLTGRVLRQLPATQQVDLSMLPAGTYTLRLTQPGQPNLVRRVVRE
jgi:hypothetical protein